MNKNDKICLSILIVGILLLSVISFYGIQNKKTCYYDDSIKQKLNLDWQYQMLIYQYHAPQHLREDLGQIGKYVRCE